MIVWGGFIDDRTVSDGRLDTGGRYTAATDTWLSTPMTGAPSPRSFHTAVWTGSEMIIWGGLNYSLSGAIGSGGRYDPSSNAWNTVSANGAPVARYGHTAVWTGSEMIVWGGYTGGNGSDPASFPISGARYNPSTNTWQSMASAGAPTGRFTHSAIWTGTEMIIWGGANGSAGGLATGGRYNPVTDTWTPTATTGAPSARASHTAVWSGSEMIIWGGNNTGGSRYEPVAGTWSAVTTAGAPVSGGPAIWSGSEMMVWGSQGARYNPTSNAWTFITTFGAPQRRSGHTAVWTGSEMIVWGGSSDSTPISYFFTGGRYLP
jgi:N-acetylneuraminic acid mutarotase